MPSTLATMERAHGLLGLQEVEAIAIEIVARAVRSMSRVLLDNLRVLHKLTLH